MASRTQPSIGIDLGTSYCCVGTWRNNTVEIITNDMGERTTPSYVSFSDTERLIGTAAKNQCARNPQNTVFNVMRLIGRKYDELQSDMKRWPFKVVPESNNRAAIQVEYKGKRKVFFPEEILSMIISYLQQIAQNYIGTQVHNAVISVPVYFNISQRESVKDAARIAGLNVLRLISSSTSASIAYGLEEKIMDDEKFILVFDLGAGILDISLVSLDDGVLEVKYVVGDIHLGGEDFTDQLVDYCVEEFIRKHKSDCTRSKRAMQRLRNRCERAKRTLSSATKVNIEIECFYDDIDFMTTISRSKFEELCQQYFARCTELLTVLFKYDKWLQVSDVHEIVLVGGSTRIPKIQEILKEYFNGKLPSKSCNADEAVAYGAAVQAAILSGTEMGDAGDLLLLDVTSFGFGIGGIGTVNDGQETQDQNTKDEKTEKTHKIHRYRVAATCQGDIFLPMVSANETIPCKSNETITTYRDNQSKVVIRVYEGNGTLLRDNKLLNTFELCNIPPAPRGVPQIEVIFDLDANLILSVSAKDKNNPTNCSKITVGSNNLSEEEIRIIMDDAARWKAEDEEKRRTIEAKNDLENSAYEMKNMLDDATFKNKGKIKNAIQQTIDWIDYYPDAKREEFEQKKQELQDLWSRAESNVDGGVSGNNEQTVLIEQLMQQNSGLQLEVNDLRSENNSLKNKLDEKDERIQDLMNKVAQLERKLQGKAQRIDYKSWQVDDVLNWIMNIENRRFRKYEQKLLIKLKEECIDGACLEDMDTNDWHRLGVTQFKDKKCLMKCIEQLIQNSQNVGHDDEHKTQGIDKWSTDDILKWVTGINLSEKWKEKVINSIKQGQFDGHDMRRLKSSQDIKRLFGFNNPMLCSRLWREWQKLK